MTNELVTSGRPLAGGLVLAALASGGLIACTESRAADGGAPLTSFTEIASPAAPGSGEPNLAVGAGGRLHMTWLEPLEAAGARAASTRRGAFALRFSTRGRDGKWSPPTTVAQGSNFFINWADFPMIAALPDGSLATHWLVRSEQGKQSYHYDVNIARSTDGGRTWSRPVVPHRDGTAAEHGFVSLFPVGRALGAVWLDGRKYAGGSGGHGKSTDEMTVRYTTIGADGALGEEVELDGRACDCCQTTAALTSAGPILAYRDRSPEEVRDISVMRLVNGRWTEPRPIHEDGWVIPACPVNGPAASAEGKRVAIAWFTAARSEPRVYVKLSGDAGASFGRLIRVDDGNPAGRVDVELLRGGAALVSWIERSAGQAEVRVRRVERNGSRGEPITVAAASAERASGFPRMARVGDEVVIAWTEPGESSRIRVASARLKS